MSGEPPDRQPLGRQAPNRRREILTAALHCFNECGVEGTTIADIRDRSGASIGSIYHHFESKEGLATALLVEGLRSNTRQLEERLRGVRGPRRGVRTVVESLIDWIADHPDWARFIYDVSSGSGSRSHRDALRAASEDHRKVIARYFDPYVEAGAFRPVPPECVPSLVVGPVHDYARRWLAGQVRGDLRERADVFAAAAWNAVGRPEGP